MTSGPQSDTRTIVTDTRTAVRNTRAGKFRSDMSLPDPINKKKLARLNNSQAIFLCASFYISVGFSKAIFFRLRLLIVLTSRRNVRLIPALDSLKK